MEKFEKGDLYDFIKEQNEMEKDGKVTLKNH
jgi:hypothetical protein